MDYKDLQAGQVKDNFWFRGKNHLIDVLLSKTCKNNRDINILNIGAGTGDDLEVLNKYGNNYLIDIDRDALSMIDNNLCVEKKLCDACDLPYENNFFDIVVSFDVFEHIKNDGKAVREVYRVLKKEGILL